MPISGPNGLIDVLVKAPGTDAFTQAGLLKVTTDGNVALYPVNPLSGAGAGLFTGGTVVVRLIPPSSPAEVRVLAWDRRAGDGTYLDSILRGSTTFTIDQLGGGGAPPALMTGFHGLQIVIHVPLLVPEPPGAVLMGVGMLAGIWIVRRKN